MSEAYTIESVGDPREWKNDYGEYLAYPLTLEGISEPVEWSRKKGSREPSAGERIAGDITNGQHGKKIKVDYDATKELSGGGSSGGSRSHGGRSKEWKPESQYDPEKTARITRAHAQEMALRLFAINEPNPSSSKQITVADVLAIADEFQADVNAAAKAAQGAGGAGTGSPVPDSREGSPAPAQRDDTHWRIEDLLQKAGVDSSGAHALSQFALTDFSVQEQDALIERLQNPNMQSAAVGRLTERYGKPLPSSPDGDDDIPF